MRAGTLLLLAILGCGQAVEPEPKQIPVIDLDAAYERVVNPIPAPPPEPSPIGAAVESFLDQAAADAEKPQPKVHVDLLTAKWCKYCPAAKAVVKPWLESKGYTVNIVDIGTADLEEYGVKSLPACLFVKDGVCLASAESIISTDLKSPYEPSFAKALKACPPPLKDKPVAFGMSVPAISVADLTESVRGMDQDLFGVVHVTVPKDVHWSVTKKSASVLLTFTPGKQPSLRSLKYIRANPNLLSVEVSPYWAEFKTDSYWPMLKTVRVDFDWSPPSAVKKTQHDTRYMPRWNRWPQQYTPVPQKPKPVVEKKPEPKTEEPVEPLKLGKSVPVIVPVAHTWRATVCIKTTTEKVVYDLFGLPRLKTGDGCGSGMIVSASGHILTNAHVVEGTKSIEVEFCDGQKRLAKVVGVDGKADLAVLKVNAVELPVVKFAESLPMVGSDVYLTGNPMGYGESVSRGIVSGLKRDIETNHGDHEGLIQVDTMTNPGNSGGPVVNAKGECIGVMVAMNQEAQGISFCIPAADAKAFVAKWVQ